MNSRMSLGAQAAATPTGARTAQPRTRARSGSRSSSLLLTAMAWTLVVFMIVPEGFDYTGAAMPTEGSLGSRLTWLALLAVGALAVLRHPGQSLALLRRVNPYLLLFGALATASLLWSIDPAVTLRRLLRVLTIFLDGMALALYAWHPTRLQSVLRPILTLMLLGSILFGLTEPKLAIEQLQQTELIGAWHGLATQKNGLGSLAGTALILWLHAWLARESRWWYVLMGGAAALSCLLLSRSSTSLMAAVFASILLLLLLRSPPGLRRYMPYLIGLFVVALLLYSLAVLNLVPGLQFVLKPITLLTGKDQTFSGRTAIWEIINDHIALQPWLGTGYGAYWVGEGVITSPSYEMVRRLYFYPTEGHNGYLDVINDLGLVGGLCLLAYLVTYLRQGLRLFRTVRVQGALYLALLFQQLIANLSESRWFNVLSIEFVIMTLATFSMGRLLWQQQRERKAAARAARAAAVRVS